MRILLWITISLIVLTAPPLAPAGNEAAADDVLIGPAVALSGDTLIVAGQTVRLWGIDAPPVSDWPLGAHALAGLDIWLADATLGCAPVGLGLRVWAICHVGLFDLAAVQLHAGHAIVFRRHTRDATGWLADRAATYDRLERNARAAQRGLWARFDD